MFAVREVAVANLELPEDRKSKERGLRLLKYSHNGTHIDLRQATRYLLNLDLTYVVFARRRPVDSGSGRTIDCSSGGLRFVGERPIVAGRKLELAVRWPLALDGGVPIQLLVCGQSVRADGRETAIRIDGYEFRACGLSDERRTRRGRRPNRTAPEGENHEPANRPEEPWGETWGDTWGEPWVARGRIYAGETSWPVVSRCK